MFLQIFKPNDGNFISLQFFEGKSKNYCVWPKKSMIILYPYRFLRLNPKYPKSLSGLKLPGRTMQAHIPTGFRDYIQNHCVAWKVLTE